MATSKIQLARYDQLPTKVSQLTNDSGYITTYTNTKNTAGTTNKASTKMFLVGATSQAASPQTYSNVNIYIGTDNCLYSNGTKVSTEGHTHSYAPTNHTHTTTIVASSGTNELTLQHGTKYAITAGGDSFVFTMPSDNNTNYYHTTGSWNGLTYTATANGGAGALAFTIPTGTSSTTVALGNHTHSNYLTQEKYTISVSGTTLTITENY